MNYGQIIGQAWQIAKKTPYFWILGFIYLFVFSIKINTPAAFAASCLSFLYGLVVFLFTLFSLFSVITYSEKKLQGSSPRFKEILSDFKHYFPKLLGFFLLLLLPLLVLILCSLVGVSTMSRLFSLNLSASGLGSLLASRLFQVLFFGFFIFSCFGLILHKLDVVKSIQHGISVSIRTFSKCFILSFLLQIPILLFYIILWSVLILIKSPYLLQPFSKVITIFPINLFNTIISYGIFLFLTISFLIAYHQFIKEYDFQTLESPSTEA